MSKRREAIAGYLFILPLFAGFFVFFFYSFFQNFLFSFTNRSAFGAYDFVGLANYERLLNDQRVLDAIGNTFLYVLFSVPAIVVCALLLANWLNMNIKFKGIYRTLIFLPAVTMPAGIGLIWRWLMNFEFGLINSWLASFGIPPVVWLNDPNVVILSISIVLIWSNVAFQMIILLAGLQGISRVYYEAAEIDGATPVQCFFNITLPLLSPTLFFVIVTSVINVLQVFDFIFLMSRPGTVGWLAGRSLVVLFFEEAFVSFNQGYAAAIVMLLFVIIMIVTGIQLFLQKKWVHYE
ncbi:MAG: sugar ABC transporter permease [Defluviitaleaceae bacterium]|nr:sugar ABC transporter permease [Defluviitaleaceae bacterium]